MKNKKDSNTGAFLFVVFVLILLITIGIVRIGDSYRKDLKNKAEIERLSGEIDAAKERRLELEKEFENINSREYIENVGRTKFGLIYPDEILIDVSE